MANQPQQRVRDGGQGGLPPGRAPRLRQSDGHPPHLRHSSKRGLGLASRLRFSACRPTKTNSMSLVVAACSYISDIFFQGTHLGILLRFKDLKSYVTRVSSPSCPLPKDHVAPRVSRARLMMESSANERRAKKKGSCEETKKEKREKRVEVGSRFRDLNTKEEETK